MTKIIITKNKAQAIVLNEILHAKTSRSHSGMMPLSDLRSRLQGQELSRKTVDTALLELAGAHAIVLQYHDDVGKVGKAEREAFLFHKGVYYFAVNLRE